MILLVPVYKFFIFLLFTKYFNVETLELEKRSINSFTKTVYNTEEKTIRVEKAKPASNIEIKNEFVDENVKTQPDAQGL